MCSEPGLLKGDRARDYCKEGLALTGAGPFFVLNALAARPSNKSVPHVNGFE